VASRRNRLPGATEPSRVGLDSEAVTSKQSIIEKVKRITELTQRSDAMEVSGEDVFFDGGFA
jgi:hypothetical protein